MPWRRSCQDPFSTFADKYGMLAHQLPVERGLFNIGDLYLCYTANHLWGPSDLRSQIVIGCHIERIAGGLGELLNDHLKLLADHLLGENSSFALRGNPKDVITLISDLTGELVGHPLRVISSNGLGPLDVGLNRRGIGVGVFPVAKPVSRRAYLYGIEILVHADALVRLDVFQ